MPMQWNPFAKATINDQAADVLRLIGNAMARDIKESMRTTRRREDGVSVAGHPPAPQTGNLLAAVVMDDTTAERGTVRVGVATTAPYGECLELASEDKRKRPFLAPAIQRAIDAFDGMIRSRDD